MRRKAEETPSAENVLVRDSMETVLKGLGFSLIELSVSRHRGSVQIRAVIYNKKGIGTDDCSKVHRAVMPRLELAFEGQDVYLEVSSPGIDRLLKDADEFACFLGRGVRCYRTDITEWTKGLLESVNEEEITLKTNEGIISLKLENIAKAKLDSSQEV